ncbi:MULTISPECIES: hypothetical protein [Acinetobacter]|uniref:hypothetical protein n=1 Tax=Acinetobacter TaxID=469 RepID=UPI001D5CC8A9|nr:MULTISPECIES: hypothetical protein [Acinetobacter]MCS4298969.1 hypothetical protein [Acinetobacter guillouiae]MCW2250384.1 hypothetical protein [Acinetobacter sp. BIGb0204]NII37519.1 hypothetical protein [Acinetobacter sp. BIGb0196]
MNSFLLTKLKSTLDKTYRLKMYKIFFSILGLPFFLVSCVNNNSHKNKVDIQEFSKLVFKGYKYEYEPGIVKPNAEMSNILISKDNMSKVEFFGVEEKIIKEGWVRKDVYNGLYIYCHGVYNKLGILYPEKNEYFDRSGSRVVFGDFNDWLIYYVYNDDGVNGCK